MVVFGLWYPQPYRFLLEITGIYLIILVVDVVCGPLLTLILASPKKSTRERTLDFSLIGCIQIIALAYGMFSVWHGPCFSYEYAFFKAAASESASGGPL